MPVEADEGGDLTDEQALKSLREDPKLTELDRFVPPLRVIPALGIGRDEVAHSRLLAALLDPRRHRGAETMLRALLCGVLRKRRLTGGIEASLESVLRAPWTNVVVQREFRFIDIVAQITSPLCAFVVGIENKVDAGEGNEQLGRYQDALRRAFPGQASAMIFLTPTGREPTTAILDHPVPTVAADYGLIVEAAEEALRGTEPWRPDRHALNEIAAHLKENILGESIEVKNTVRELWRDHGRALRLAMEHRPRLEDVRVPYEALLRERFGDDANIYHWRPRGELREIKMRLHSWYAAGFPFDFIFYADREGLPVVRLLLWAESYDTRSAPLKKWAREVNVADPDLIDEGFPKLRDWWGWRRVFREEDHPAGAVLHEQAFDEATARTAAEAVEGLYDKLRPHIATARTV